METNDPPIDPVAGARALVGWVEDPQVGPLRLGYALDLWLALTGNPTDPDDPGYEDGMRAAMDTAHWLAEPEPEAPTVTVVDVEVVRGEVL